MTAGRSAADLGILGAVVGPLLPHSQADAWWVGQLGLVNVRKPDRWCCAVPQVDHEPSVPTLEVLLLSCLAFAAVHCLQATMAAAPNSLARGRALLLQCAAAVVAVVFELLVSGSGWMLTALGVGLVGSRGCLESGCYGALDTTVLLAIQGLVLCAV